LVIRPDSGDPVDIICGEQVISRDYRDVVENAQLDLTHPKYKGVIELLWDVFGGTVNEQGYKVLDSHIGAIYGDSITIDRAEEICKRLEAKGFASTNIVLGVGSFTYQFNTRDTFGFAMKATYVEVNGEEREIFKDPITDDGTKKSARGLLKVFRTTLENEVVLHDQCTWAEEEGGILQTIYKDGKFVNVTTLTQIREKLK
jgi:nicotinamide phosphoribosyltransferase